MIDPQLHNNFQELMFFLNSTQEGSYVGIFFASLLVGYLLPIPELVVLLLIGFAVWVGGMSMPLALIASFAGTVLGDNAMYRLSFFGNVYVERFNRKMRENKLIKYENLVLDNIGKSIFFLRFVTGVRFFGPVISGTLGVRWRTFFFYNVFATFIRNGSFILLGFYAHQNIFSVIIKTEIISNGLLFSSVFIVGILLRIFSKKNN